MINKSGDYQIRTFRFGDEIDLVKLFNKCYKDFVGFVPRTIEYWTWCCLNRPGIDKESIIIVSKNEEIIGYAVVGQSEVLEFCHDPQHNGETIATILLTQIQERIRKMGGDSVALNVPVNDKDVRRACQKLGFIETPPEQVFLNILNMPGLIQAILKDKNQSLNVNGTFWFNLKNCPAWCTNSFGFQIKDNTFSVLNEPNNSEVEINTDLTTLFSCILRTENVWRSIMTFKVQVQPIWKIPKFLKLFSVLKIERLWYMPKADNG